MGDYSSRNIGFVVDAAPVVAPVVVDAPVGGIGPNDPVPAFAFLELANMVAVLSKKLDAVAAGAARPNYAAKSYYN